MLNKILIIFIIYNKKITSLSIFQNIFDIDINIFIYDNSKFPQEIPIIKNVNIFYEHDENNNGVSRGYNQAYKKAKELKKELLLILDQDTNFNIDYLNEYLNLHKIYKNDFIYAPIICNNGQTKIYSPFFLNNFVGKIQNFKNFIYKEKYNLQVKSVINSGLMIPIEIFEKIGGYNEKLKLDFSDIYFIEKYKNINKNIILINITITHSLSADEGKNLDKELHRFKYFCSSVKELSKVLDKTIIWAPLRRLLRLTLKYKTFNFCKIFFQYYFKGKEV